MIEKFFREHSHLKLSLQHLGVHGGSWRIQIYNTTLDFGIDPIFEHYITDETIKNLNIDFETVIMSPIINWLEDIEKKRKEEGEIEWQ